MSTRNILLLFGGESAEHDISIRSARNIYDALDKDKYDTSLCYIGRDGQWWLVSEVSEPHNPTNRLAPVLGQGKLVTVDGTELTPDVIFPALHGPNGEDGSVQGLAQLLHAPIVGCGIIGSAACMDKDVAKRLLKQADIRVADGVVHIASQPQPDFAELTRQLGDVVFIKPANLGSSVGVSKVTTADEFTHALALAHQHDRKVLIERGIKGRELECAVLGNDQPEASVVGEILPGDEFYSYDAKYADDSKAQTSVHAELPEDVEEKIRETALRAYEALECRGLARVDFFLADDGVIYVNEINTLPGFTSISMYPQLWQASGKGYSMLLDRLVDLALQ